MTVGAVPVCAVLVSSVSCGMPLCAVLVSAESRVQYYPSRGRRILELAKNNCTLSHNVRRVLIFVLVSYLKKKSVYNCSFIYNTTLIVMYSSVHFFMLVYMNDVLGYIYVFII